ncbi:MAG: DUF5011 domain-containing protein [Bacteroidetes bacterium]|nr:DUF5011 domain-containing protein [Bacteroidota bacterium]
MNKRIALLPALFLALSSLVYTGCKDDEDTTPPVVTLNGDQNVTIYLQGTFTDPGATAVDDEDGTVTVSTSGTVDNNFADDYTITYSATDAAGNSGTNFRVVTVANELGSSAFEGTYNCIITSPGIPTYTYSESLTLSNSLNKALEWSKFGDYSNANAKLNIVIGTNKQVTAHYHKQLCVEMCQFPLSVEVNFDRYRWFRFNSDFTN